MDPVTMVVLVISGMLLMGALGEYIFSRTGIPDMIWLVALGILAGPVLGLIRAEVLTPVLPFFGAFALVVILAGGATQLHLGEVVNAAPRALLLAVTGFVVSVLAVCLLGWLLTVLGVLKSGASLGAWIMIGGIVGGSSSVVIIPTLAGAKVEGNVSRLLEVESCITDALCIVVAMAMLDLLVPTQNSSTGLGQALVSQVGLGAGLGAVGGMLLAALRPITLGKAHRHTVLLAGFLILYGAINAAGGNGALGVLVSGLIFGNARDLIRKLGIKVAEGGYADDPDTAKVHARLTFFIKSFFFFMIGLMFPSSPRIILIGLLFAVVLTIFRFPAVRFALWGAGFDRNQQRVISIAMPRGMAAGVLSALPLHRGIPSMDGLVPAVFAIIVFTIMIFAGGFALLKHTGRPDQAASGLETD